MKVRRVILIYFPKDELELLAKIDAAAAARGIPFSQMAWDLIRRGLARVKAEREKKDNLPTQGAERPN